MRARPPSIRQGGNALASCKRSTPRSPGSGAFATCGKAGATIGSCGSRLACSTSGSAIGAPCSARFGSPSASAPSSSAWASSTVRWWEVEPRASCPLSPSASSPGSSSPNSCSTAAMCSSPTGPSFSSCKRRSASTFIRPSGGHLIILAHNLLIYVVIALLYGIWPSWQTLLVVPGIILVGINGISIGMNDASTVCRAAAPSAEVSQRKLARSSFKPDLARSAASNDVAPSR